MTTTTLHTKAFDATPGNKYRLIGALDDGFITKTSGTTNPTTYTTNPWCLRILVGVLGTVGGVFLVYMGIGTALVSFMATDDTNADTKTLVRVIGGIIFFGFLVVLLGIALLVASCRYAFGRQQQGMIHYSRNFLGLLLVDLLLALVLYVAIDWASARTLDNIVSNAGLVVVLLVRWLPSGCVAMRGLCWCRDCSSPNGADEADERSMSIPAIALVEV